MFNIDRELELYCSSESDLFTLSPNHPVRRDSDNRIYAEIDRRGHHYDRWYFDGVTGVFDSHDGKDNGVWRLRAKSEMRPITHFFLRGGRREWSKDDWVKLDHECFSEGPEAAARSKDLNLIAGEADSLYRFTVKKEVELSPIRDYANWAAERFETKEWTPVLWANEAWTSAFAHHFAHASKADDSKVAYWASEADAQIDIITTMAPGRYLQNYFSQDLTPNEIRDWAVKHDAEAELKVTMDAEGIYNAYVQNGQGCMRYADHQNTTNGTPWKGGKNPVRVYAAGDLGVAYLERKGKVIGRALVWPEKKLVGRIYGDIERMQDALASDGWTFDCTDHSVHGKGKGGFNGARILKIHPEGSPLNYLMPYFDFGYGLRNEDEFFTMHRDYSFVANSTEGVMFDLRCEPPELGQPGVWINEDDEDDISECDSGDCDCCFTCDRCGERGFDNDNRNTVEDQWLCGGCYEAHASTCQVCDDNFFDVNMTSDQDGNRYCNRRCAEARLVSCDYCSDMIDHEGENLVVVLDGRDTNEIMGDSCMSCVDNDTSLVMMGEHIVDASTVTHCDDCNTYYSNNLDECPTHELETVA